MTVTIFILIQELFELNIEEGDIVTFPGYYAHKSPINNFDEDKIIIAFNTDLVHGDVNSY